jgi:hypothetical protein
VIDHERRHLIEEFPKNLLGLFRQCSFSKGTIHQAHPSIAGALMYMERRMPRAQAWMASLFDVSVRAAEPTDQEISEALLSTREIPRRIHGSQKIILRDLPIEGGHQARETFRADHGVNFEFLHLLFYFSQSSMGDAVPILEDAHRPQFEGSRGHQLQEMLGR